MCTAATYKTKDFYMGRTLDYECSYGEEVTITPRGYTFMMRHGKPYQTKYALIGMAHVAGEYPLYYDAINEKGLGMAGLNFVGNAFYTEPAEGKDNVAQFELIPWILGQCTSVKEARVLLERICITNISFHESMPVSSHLAELMSCRFRLTAVEWVRLVFRVIFHQNLVLFVFLL